MKTRVRIPSLVVWSVAALALLAGLRASGLAGPAPDLAAAAEEEAASKEAGADGAGEEAVADTAKGEAKASRRPDLKRGRAIYFKNCVQCHKANGSGGVKTLATGNPAPNFRDPEYWKEKPDAVLVRATTEGIPKSGMVAWKGTLSPEEIQDVVAFVRERFEPRRKPDGDEETAAEEKEAAPAEESPDESAREDPEEGDAQG